MTALQDLGAFALLGALGSLHCIGMCGGFAIAAVRGAQGRGGALRHGLGFGLGKALTYALLGMLAILLVRAGAALGLALSGEGALEAESWRATSGWLAWAAGLVLIVAGSGQLLRIRHGGLLARFVRRPLELLRQALRPLDGASGAFGTGVVTGLLPCGLSWSALALVATRPPSTAILGLLVFGLFTSPLLVSFALGWRSFSARSRVLGMRLGGVLLIAFGLVTVARGGQVTGNDSPPPCCSSDLR